MERYRKLRFIVRSPILAFLHLFFVFALSSSLQPGIRHCGGAHAVAPIARQAYLPANRRLGLSRPRRRKWNQASCPYRMLLFEKSLPWDRRGRPRIVEDDDDSNVTAFASNAASR